MRYWACIFISIFTVTALFTTPSFGHEAENPQNYYGENYYTNSEIELPLTSYKPTYIGITGSHNDKELNGQGKIQMSFKFELLEDSDVYFAYTHKAFADFQEKSTPIRENNYAPEIFNIFTINHEINPTWLKTIKMGWVKHESAGLPKGNPQGWNISYIEPMFVYKQFKIEPLVRIPLFFQNDAMTKGNTDIFDYYGYFDLNLAYRHKFTQHSLLLRKGSEGSAPTFQYQVDLDAQFFWELFRLPEINHWNTKVFLQYWSGYGESIETYNQDTERLTIGYSFVR